MFRDFNRSMLPTAVWCIKLNPYIKYYITIDFSWLIKQFRIYLIAHKHSYVSLRTTPSICKARKAGGSAHKANDKCAPKIHRKCQSKCFPSNCFYYANRIKSHSHAEISSEYILNDDIYMQLYIYILYVYECVCAFNSRSMLLIANTLKPQVACNNWRRSEAGLAYVRTCVYACMCAFDNDKNNKGSNCKDTTMVWLPRSECVCHLSRQLCVIHATRIGRQRQRATRQGRKWQVSGEASLIHTYIHIRIHI